MIICLLLETYAPAFQLCDSSFQISVALLLGGSPSPPRALIEPIVNILHAQSQQQLMGFYAQHSILDLKFQYFTFQFFLLAYHFHQFFLDIQKKIKLDGPSPAAANPTVGTSETVTLIGQMLQAVVTDHVEILADDNRGGQISIIVPATELANEWLLAGLESNHPIIKKMKGAGHFKQCVYEISNQSWPIMELLVVLIDCLVLAK